MKGELMASGRMLLKKISKSKPVNQLSCDTARLLFTWMLAHLDCNGAIQADPVLVKNTVFPWREDIKVKDVVLYIDEMENLGLIQRYGEEGQYLFYPNFDEEQPKIQKDREAKPEIPPPTPELLQSYSRVTHELLQSNTRVTHTQNKIKQSKVNQSKVKEGQSEQEPESYSCTYFSITDSKAQELCSAYGLTCDILKSECTKMKIWLDSNPRKRKKNYDRFIQNWLSRVDTKNLPVDDRRLHELLTEEIV